MIKTIFVFAFLVISPVFLFPFGIFMTILDFAGLKRQMAQFGYIIAKYWARFLIKVIGCRVTAAGIENIPKTGALCFVSNHCGYFDVVMLFAYASRPFGFVAKKELLLLPFFNCWIYILGGLFIDRGSAKKALRAINKGVQKIKKGSSMLIFPEGHRSKGRGLLPFHPGSLKLATMADAPIVPVAIEGSYDVFEKTGRVTAADVKISFCDVIYTADLPSEDKKQVLSERIYNAINMKLTKDNSL